MRLHGNGHGRHLDRDTLNGRHRPLRGVIVSDSLSIYDALQWDPYRVEADLTVTWKRLHELGNRATIFHWVWVSSHCGILRNDIADGLAAAGAEQPHDGVPYAVGAVRPL